MLKSVTLPPNLERVQLLLCVACPPPAVVELCHKFKEQLVGDPRAARGGICPLLAALQRLAPSKEHLTPIHADVLQL
jgi:hypothetical protein